MATTRKQGPPGRRGSISTMSGSGKEVRKPVSGTLTDVVADHAGLMEAPVRVGERYDFLLLRRGDLAVEAMDVAVAQTGVVRCYPYRDRWRWLRRLYMEGRASPALLRAFTARLGRHTPHSLKTLMELHLRSGVDLVCPVVNERGYFDI